MRYSTEMRTLVDISGYLPFFETFSVTTHEAEPFGAFSLVPTMAHGPDSLQVFFPVDNDETSDDKRVDDAFLTTDFFTIKPGRTAS